MLKKAILGTPKAFKVSIGSLSHCTASVEKSLYAPGELVTVTIAYNVGHNNAVVGTSTGTQVKKVSDTKYTFLMPNNDVVITASASVMSFKISVNKNDGGNVSVKSVANYGETVTVTLSPAEGYSVGNVSASGVGLSGSGNTRTFSMPAGNVVLNVSFKLEYHVIMTVGYSSPSRQQHYGYQKDSLGSLSRIPYWNSITSTIHTLEGHGRSTFSSNIFWIYDVNNAPKRDMRINGFLFPKGTEMAQVSPSYITYNSKEGASLFWGKEGQQIALIFDPPPYRIPIRKSIRYLPALLRRAR